VWLGVGRYRFVVVTFVDNVEYVVSGDATAQTCALDVHRFKPVFLY
jgi:hypothetical protein